MNINPDHKNEPDLGVDPVTMINDKVRDKLTFRHLALASYLKDRQVYYENVMETSSQDASSMVVVERLAFYEMTIDALIQRQGELEKRLGGGIGNEGKN